MGVCVYGYLCVWVSVCMDISVYGCLCVWVSVCVCEYEMTFLCCDGFRDRGSQLAVEQALEKFCSVYGEHTNSIPLLFS